MTVVTVHLSTALAAWNAAVSQLFTLAGSLNFKSDIVEKCATVGNFSKHAFCHAFPTLWNNNHPQTIISDLTATTSTFKNRL